MYSLIGIKEWPVWKTIYIFEANSGIMAKMK
jgi:hypothetical protein